MRQVSSMAVGHCRLCPTQNGFPEAGAGAERKSSCPTAGGREATPHLRAMANSRGLNTHSLYRQPHSAQILSMIGLRRTPVTAYWSLPSYPVLPFHFSSSSWLASTRVARVIRSMKILMRPSKVAFIDARRPSSVSTPPTT